MSEFANLNREDCHFGTAGNVRIDPYNCQDYQSKSRGKCQDEPREMSGLVPKNQPLQNYREKCQDWHNGIFISICNTITYANIERNALEPRKMSGIGWG